ncbi:hypothetical protein BC827DRAFT_1133179 [Russula dissimulans]|nr:hypothetical protein BC827DRAFT_1133179 [Russula dissimulans]
MFIYSSDLALRQPLTLTAIFPLVLSYYAQAVLTLLPNTFFLRLLLLPFIQWQAWRCIVGYDFGALLAQWFGYESSDKFAFWNLMYTCSIFCISLRSLEWTFIKKPLRRYEPPKRDQSVEQLEPLTPSKVLVDAFDLLQSMRGLGWSWSPRAFPHESTPPTSIALLAAKTLLKFTVLDTLQYILQRVCPSIDNPGGGGSIFDFDPNLSFLPRTALATFSAICGGTWTYAWVDSVYHLLSLVGRIILRQPASQWPPAFHQPWLSTSIHEFWSFRWHQVLRHFFVTFGARPGGKLFGKPGAFIGAFALSAFFHHVGVWGIGSGTELITTGGFFLLMGVGAVMEIVLKQVTGMRVQGWAGWAWTMSWTILWGAFMIDGWAKHGVLATVTLPNRLRIGKMVVDTIIGLSSR